MLIDESHTDMLLNEVISAANEKAVSIKDNECGILVWDDKQYCRYYSMMNENFHFSVPSLNGFRSKHSFPINVTYVPGWNNEY